MIYDDLLALKRDKLMLSRMKPLGPSELKALVATSVALPTDYVAFISEIGYGEIGNAQYMIYGGLMEPDEIYGTTSPEVSNILLFGDDFQGFNAGFKIDDGWRVVEIDPLDMRVSAIASDFQTFIRRKISQIQ